MTQTPNPLASKTAVAIRLENCQKTYNHETIALHPLDLTIHPGEILVLLGPSGCGKTTLLRLIAGLEQADAGGKLFFQDQDVTQLAINKRRIGMVFQSYALFPNMRVADNITYGLRVRGQKKSQIKQRLQDMLALFDLTPYANRHISQLSGGQCQRVALARAIITEPDVLLLDEPLSALDALLRERLRTDIQQLLKQLNITAVYVTHDQQEAMAIADRIAVMNDGKLVQIGTPEQLYLTPQTPFVADFVGQINRLYGDTENGHLAVEGGGRLALPKNASATMPETSAATAYWMARPEDIRATTATAEYAFPATVKNHQFLGDRTRIMLVYGQQRPLILDCFERRHYREGETLHVTVSPPQLIAVNASAS